MKLELLVVLLAVNNIWFGAFTWIMLGIPGVLFGSILMIIAGITGVFLRDYWNS